MFYNFKPVFDIPNPVIFNKVIEGIELRVDNMVIFYFSTNFSFQQIQFFLVLWLNSDYSEDKFFL